MSNIPTQYRSYLIRMWVEGSEPLIWRFSVENIHDQSRYGFNSLEELFAFLEHKVTELGKTKKPLKGDIDSGYDEKK